MIRRTIILPTQDNDGNLLMREIARCEQELLRVSGGYTAHAAIGKWSSGPSVYTDASRVYFAILTEAQDSALMRVLPAWCALLRQEALYTDRAEVNVEFVAPATPAEVAS